MVNDGLPVFYIRPFLFSCFLRTHCIFRQMVNPGLCLGHIEILVLINRRDKHNPGHLGVVLFDTAFIQVISLCVEGINVVILIVFIIQQFNIGQALLIKTLLSDK